MEYSYHNSQYKSIDSVLGSFYSDLFDAITIAMRPVIGGVDYLRNVHKLPLVQIELYKISNWDFEKRNRLLDALTDMVSTDDYSEEFAHKIETKLSELKEFNETFKKL